MIAARLAPHVMMENIKAAQDAERHDVLSRYKKMAILLTGRVNAKREDGVLWANMMLDKLSLPTLSQFGVCSTSFDVVAEDALKSVAIKGNPLPLTKQRLTYILQQVCNCNDDCLAEDSSEQSSARVVNSGLSDVEARLQNS